MTTSLLSGESTLISSHCYIPLVVMLVIYRKSCLPDWLASLVVVNILNRYITSSTSSQGISVRLDWAPRAFSSCEQTLVTAGHGIVFDAYYYRLLAQFISSVSRKFWWLFHFGSLTFSVIFDKSTLARRPLAEATWGVSYWEFGPVLALIEDLEFLFLNSMGQLLPTKIFVAWFQWARKEDIHTPTIPWNRLSTLYLYCSSKK